jgi:hypothetical protein
VKRKIVMLMLVGCVSLVGMMTGAGCGIVPCDSEYCDGYEPHTFEPSMALSAGHPTTDTATQDLTLEVWDFPLGQCNPQVWFGEIPIAATVELLDQDTYRLRLRLAVPSWFEGDFQVRLACGDWTLASAEPLYHGFSKGWVLAAPTTYEAFAGFENGAYQSQALADFDGDSLLDQAVTRMQSFSEYQPRHLAIHWGNRMPDGSLRYDEQVLPLELPDDDVIHPVVAADFDGDGRPDLAWVARCSVQILLNRGGRRFEPQPVLTMDCRHPLPIAPGDFCDEYVPAAWNLAAGDLDGDGDTDLFVVMDDDLPRVLLNDGSGWLSELPDAVTPRLPQEGAAALLTDLNGDGSLDVLLANGWASFTCVAETHNQALVNDGDGHFRLAEGLFDQEDKNSWSLVWLPAAGDLPAGVLFENEQEPPSFYRLDDQAGLVKVGALGIGKPGTLIRTARANPVEPLLVLGDSGTQLVSYSRGSDGAFVLQAAQPSPVGLPVHSKLDLADLDGDGELDLVAPGALLFFRDLTRFKNP